METENSKISKAPSRRTSERRSVRGRMYRGKRDFRGNNRLSRPSLEESKEESYGPITSSDNLRIIPLGGVEEVGRNMTAIEYKGDIVVIDAGLQFPGEEHPGISYIIPNTKYLEMRKDKIRGIIISHGHLDHVGGIPYIIDRIGNPPIYATRLSKAMIMKRNEEFPHLPHVNIVEVSSKDIVPLGKNFKARFFDITHTIPDAVGIILETDLGNIVYPGDFKINHDGKGSPSEAELALFEKLGKDNNLVLMLESTNVERPGFSFTEAEVHKNLERLFRETKGRIIIATFASLLERIIEVVRIAEKLGRKVAIDGRSIKVNLEIATELGLAKFKKGTFVPIEDFETFPPEKILAIVTGAQGEENAVLMRTADRRHKHIKIHKGDTVYLSASAIPGNERSIDKLKDDLTRQGAKVIHYGIEAIHSSGHAYREELRILHRVMRSKFFIPVHGNYYRLAMNGELAKETGMPEANIMVPERNSIIIETDGKTIAPIKEMAPSSLVVVDGSGVGDVKEVVLRDRQALAEDGIFVVVATVQIKTGKVLNSPDIISRGFIYLRESQDLLKQTRYVIRKSIEEMTARMNPINMAYVRESLREKVTKFLFQKTKRKPMVLPVIIEV